MKQWTLLLGLALIAAPAAAHAQQGGQGGRAQGPRAGARRAQQARQMAANRLQFLVAHGSELKLTPAQLDRIRSRQAQLEAANKPLVEKLRAARGERASQPRTAQPDREATRARREQLRPTLEQLRKNGQEAWKDAVSYLTKDQVKQAQALRKERATALQTRMKARQDRMNERQERMKARQQQGK